MKVKSHLDDVDLQVTKIRSATTKNQANQAKPAAINCLPQLVTRWKSWRNATTHLAKKLPEVKAMVESFERSGIFKEAVQTIQELYFGEDICSITVAVKKKCEKKRFQNNEHRKTKHFTSCLQFT